MADLGSLLGAAGIGGAIGKAIVQLELDTGKYSAELKGAQAQTVAGANSMSSGFAKFGGLAKTALLGAGAAAVAFGAYSVKAAVEANDAHLKLTNTFQNNARLADSSVGAFERQADSIRALTGVDDEAIISGQALLGSFKLTGEQVQELTPLVVDLASKYNIDLQTAFKAVGKATQGNAGVLSRYGVTLDEAKLAADGFGTTLKGLGVAQGFAAQRADNEPWRVLASSFEEIAEKLGVALIPLLRNLANGIEFVLPFLEGLITGFIQLGHWVGNVVKALGDFYDMISRGVPVTDEMVTLIGKVAGPLMDTAEAADAAGGAVSQAGEEFERFAKMGQKDFKEWAKSTDDSIHTTIFALNDLGDQSDVTAKTFIESQHDMLVDAREFARAMKELAGADWVNEGYKKFLIDEGPAAVVGFSKLNEEQQERWSDRFKRTSEAFNNSVGLSFKDLTGTLDNLDRKTTRHNVEIHYKYVDFDPSMPGMQTVGGGQGPRGGSSVSGADTAKRPP